MQVHVKPPLRDRLLARTTINPETGCWEWTGARLPTGYGMLRDGARVVRAHRASYELLVGPILEGLVLDHLCRVRHCINPAHLEPVTQQINTLRGEGFAAVNAAKANCPRGHLLTPENTYTDARGSRSCRICRRASNAAYEARKAAV